VVAVMAAKKLSARELDARINERIALMEERARVQQAKVDLAAIRKRAKASPPVVDASWQGMKARLKAKRANGCERCARLEELVAEQRQRLVDISILLHDAMRRADEDK
jgi:hypothetical protein